MGRLIDADALKDIIEEWLDCVGNVVIGKSLSYYAELEGCIDECPTVDAEPVRHGHVVWRERTTGGYKYIDVKCHNCGATENVEIEHPIMDSKIAYCSECEKRLDDIFMRYCPNCGAKMDAE